MNASEERSLGIFERRILRRIFGAVKDGEVWGKRYNEEIEELIGNETIVRHIKAERIRWLGHVQRTSEERMPRKIMKGVLYGNRRRGRPRKRWIDDVEKDLVQMGIQKWRRIVQERDTWKTVVKEAKANKKL